MSTITRTTAYGKEYQVYNGTYYHRDTPREVIELLDTLRRDGEVVRVHYGDVSTGRDWEDENDTLGRVGRSMGPVKIPLLIADGECSGPGLLDHCIVMIRQGDHVLYQHPQYHHGR